MTGVLRAEGVTRVFTTPAGDVTAVDGVDLEVAAGELVVVRGRSGSGRTTLLTMLGGLDRPTRGRGALAPLSAEGTPARRSVSAAPAPC